MKRFKPLHTYTDNFILRNYMIHTCMDTHTFISHVYIYIWYHRYCNSKQSFGKSLQIVLVKYYPNRTYGVLACSQSQEMQGKMWRNDKYWRRRLVINSVGSVIHIATFVMTAPRTAHTKRNDYFLVRYS